MGCLECARSGKKGTEGKRRSFGDTACGSWRALIGLSGVYGVARGPVKVRLLGGFEKRAGRWLFECCSLSSMACCARLVVACCGCRVDVDSLFINLRLKGGRRGCLLDGWRSVRRRPRAEREREREREGGVG